MRRTAPGGEEQAMPTRKTGDPRGSSRLLGQHYDSPVAQGITFKETYVVNMCQRQGSQACVGHGGDRGREGTRQGDARNKEDRSHLNSDNHDKICED